jgi:two-component system sensor histidine kinase GlrK
MDLSTLIMRSIREMTPLATAKNIRIDSDIGEISYVFIDSERILQILRNLIGNALKFTPPGGTVSVAVRQTEKGAHLSVTDTGPGIPREELDVIFDKFRQALSNHSPRFQGTGLGLAIVRHIAEAHGGKVWVESEVGLGSTFTFVLPV